MARAKEVRNFKLKFLSGPEGSIGLDSDNNTENSDKNHLQYVSRVISADLCTEFIFKVTKELLNSHESESWGKTFSKIEITV